MPDHAAGAAEGPEFLYDGYVFDLDGTIYLGDELLPGVGRLLARLVATNLDRWCPFPGGRGEPDAGAIVAAIEACTGVTCEVNAGKPDPLMLEAAMELLGLEVGDCLMVGDRLSTDIAMARAAGMPSAVVLTGETTSQLLAATPPEDRPTWVLDRIDRLLPASL